MARSGYEEIHVIPRFNFLRDSRRGLARRLRLPKPPGAAQSGKQAEGGENAEKLPQPRPFAGITIDPAPASLLNSDVKPIDLCSALKLAGVENPEILLARERITAADAARLYAAAQILPNLNHGGNYDAHQGTLQQSNGKIIEVNRDSLYLGLGANAVAAGTVNMPGIVWNANVSDAIYTALVARQVVTRRRFESDAVRNDVLLRVVTAYLELLRRPAGGPSPPRRAPTPRKWHASRRTGPKRARASSLMPTAPPPSCSSTTISWCRRTGTSRSPPRGSRSS